jgi:hypothetical protein
VSTDSRFEVRRFLEDVAVFFATVLPPTITPERSRMLRPLLFEDPLNPVNQLVHRLAGQIEIHDRIRIQFVSAGIL